MSRLLLLGAAESTIMVVPPVDPTSDTAAIQAAIDEAYDAGGGVVGLVGAYTINAPIVLKNGVFLQGVGWSGSQIHLDNDANCHMIITPTDDTAQFCGASDIMLDGHREDNPTGGDGFHFDSLIPDYTFAQCAVKIVERVLVQYTKGHGFYAGDGCVEDRYTDCYAFSVGGSGFKSTGGSDMWWTNCTSGESLSDGFSLVGQLTCRLQGCKSWWSGRQNAVRANTNPGVGAGLAVGFRLAGTGWQITNCQAQDSSGPGMALASTSGYAQVYLDMNGAGMGSGQSIQADLDYSDGLYLNIIAGHDLGRFKTDYVLNVNDTFLRSRVDVMRVETGTNDNLRPGSIIDESNVITYNIT